MTKGAALLEFFEQFGIPAYASTNVDPDAKFPYLTYEAKLGNFGDPPISCGVNLWYRTAEEATPNAKAMEIADAIGRGGRTVPYDGGMIWIKRAEPWCQPIADDDPVIKRRFLNLMLEYY